MFINPFGGKRAAEGHYSRYCQPLFKLAGITCDTVVTTRAGQIYEAALQLSPDHSYDGIICCGGDGTFAELVNGLLRREVRYWMIAIHLEINEIFAYSHSLLDPLKFRLQKSL